MANNGKSKPHAHDSTEVREPLVIQVQKINGVPLGNAL